MNSATGSYVATVSDAELPVVGIPINLARSYNSADTASGTSVADSVLGQGWSFGYRHRLRKLNDDTVEFTSGEGQVLLFDRRGSQWVGRGGVTADLIENPEGGGGFAVRTRALYTYTFADDGRLLRIRDRNGQGLDFGHDIAGRILSISGSGRSVTLAYNSEGHLARATLPDGRWVGYSYTNGLLTSVRDLTGRSMTYQYDTQGRIAQETDALGVTQMRIAYDAQTGRVSDQWDARGGHTTFTWNPQTQTSVMTDPRGGKWTDTYSGGVINRRVDPLGRVTAYGYDEDRQLLWTRDPGGDITSMRYDAAGNIIESTSPFGTVTTTYDSRHNPIAATNARGVETTFSYDTAGNLTRTIRRTPDNSTFTDSYAYDSRGLTTASTDATGAATTYSYSAAGDLTSTTSAEGRKQTFAYDQTGRLLSSVEPRGNVAGADPQQYRTTYTYNNRDQLIRTTDPLGHQWSTSYDAVGQPTTSTDPNNRVTTYTHDNAGQLTAQQGPDPSIAPTTWTYDTVGNTLSEKDPAGRTVTYTYDLANQTTVVTNPLGRHTMTYDNDGNTTQIIGPGPFAGSTRGVFIYYNAQDRPTRMAWSRSPTAVTYEYDIHGNRTRMAKEGQQAVTYSYDGLDRPTNVTRGTQQFNYTYDKAGRVDTAQNPAGSFGYSYDADGLLRTVTDTANVTPNNPAQQIAAYTYNRAGNPSTATLGNGTSWSRTYDTAGRIASNTHTTPAPATPNVPTDVVLSEQYTLDPVGNPTAISSWIADGTTAAPQQRLDTYRYDTLDRLTAVCYDVTTTQSSQGCQTGGPVTGGSTVEDYIAWTYDAVGNRTTETRPSGTSTYSYAASTGLLDRIQPATGSAVTYDWDERGRLTEAGDDRFAYNNADMMTTSVVDDVETQYTYDGDGRRIRSLSTGADGAVEQDNGYLWDPVSYQLVGLTEPAASGDSLESYGVAERYASGLGQVAVAPGSSGTQTAPSRWSYLHQDSQSSIRAVTGPDGSLDATADYEPFGLTRASNRVDASAQTPSLGWAGEIADNTGQSHLRMRQYDPNIGAFTSPDPVPATTYSATRTYSNTNPMTGNDPMGTFSFDARQLAESVNSVASVVAGAAGVGALVFPPLGVVAGVAGLATAASSLYLAYDTCANGKGSCGGALLDAALDSTLGLVPGGLGRAGMRLARTAARACSFEGSTAVLLADGSKKPIDQVEVGDRVIATDPETDDQATRRVQAVFVHRDLLVDLQLADGSILRTTDDHPYWSVTRKRFTRADRLERGEEVLGADGRTIKVRGVLNETRRTGRAFNLNVRGIHTYHVGPREILVHNVCGAAGRAPNWSGFSNTSPTRRAAEGRARQDAARRGGCFRSTCKSGDHYHVDYVNGKDQITSTVHYRWRRNH